MHSIADLIQHSRGQWQLLQVQEQQMASRWQDQTYFRFRQRHWVNWETRVPALLSTLESLDDVLRSADEMTQGK